MCRVPVQLRELVKQRLSAAADEIFELLEKTITEYEEQTERQRTLLEQLLQPKDRLSPPDRDVDPVRAAESPCEPPHIKEERDVIKTQVCRDLKTDEPLPAPTWNPSPSPVPAQQDVTEEENGVKTEEGRTWTPPLHHIQAVSLPPIGGALLQHTHTVPLLTPGDALLQHTQTVPLPPPGSALLQHTHTVPLPPPGDTLLHHTQAEEKSLPQDRWTEQSLHLSQPGDNPEPPQPVLCPGPSATLTLCPPGDALPQAMRSQKRQKRFHCTLCPKAFASNFHLVSHMRVHTGERPFECPVCEKGFRVKGNLDQHMMIHYDLRPFSCTFCGKAFSQKSNLNNHLWVHTGVKPFSCSVCGKQYRQRSSLSLHMASH